MDPNTELARFMLPRDRFGLGDEDPDVEDSAIVAPSMLELVLRSCMDDGGRLAPFSPADTLRTREIRSE
jgi:hypothetical protein